MTQRIDTPNESGKGWKIGQRVEGHVPPASPSRLCSCGTLVLIVHKDSPG